MALTKQKKSEMLSVLEKIASDAGSIVFVSARGMKVSDTMNMRDALAAAGAKFKVVKKTLLKRALQSAGFSGDMPELPGELAVAYSDDLTAPAREVWNFAKKFQDQITMLGGVFEKAFLDAAGITAIATIPPVPVLRGMFVNVINSPIQGLVLALNAIAQKKA